MSIEVACPACGGSIQIEDVSEVVACPLCEVHLEFDPETREAVLVSEASAEEEEEVEIHDQAEEVVPDESKEANSTAGESDPGEDIIPNQEALGDEQHNTEESSPFAFLPGGNHTKPEKAKPVRPATNFSFLPGGGNEPEESDTETETETIEPTAEAITSQDELETPVEEPTAEVESVPEEMPEEFAGEESVAEQTIFEESAAEISVITESTITEEENGSSVASLEELVTEEPMTEETFNEVASSEVTTITKSATEAEDLAETDTLAEASTEPETPVVEQSYRKGKVVPKRLFTLTLTYAIAATILVAMLLYAKYLGDPHQLESLPDLKPPIKNDEIALQLVPENANLPAGHTLKLGGPGRRFGNVLVTPLRVTRGPLEFEHYTGDSTKTRKPTQDVLKLHLKFENVSSDQTFEPLDQKLLLTRVPGKTEEAQLRANNFVCRVDQKRTDAERVLVYDMPPSWEWNLKGQNINLEKQTQKLEPGQSFETYVATNEAGIDSLTGDLVWRIQLRKGYHPKSHRGVTTLIEVLFNSDQIQAETPSPKKETLPTS